MEQEHVLHNYINCMYVGKSMHYQETYLVAAVETEDIPGLS